MNKRKWEQFAKILLIVAMLMVLPGCGDAAPQEKVGVTKIENIEDLEDGGYYVQHNNAYYQLYLGQTSFDPKKATTERDSDRIAWFGADYANIPTMYKGDTIVYHSTKPFAESIAIERFEDFGYTVGVCQMRKSSSGRFTFLTDSRQFNVNIDSDAGRLCQHRETTATFERIGGVNLRAGNISRAGTILGLSKDKTYNCDIYIGTELYEYAIIADVKALCSMEVINVEDYSFNQSRTITINLPNNLQSGYYYVGGYGFVRYINNPDEKFVEGMDMNIPNDMQRLYDDSLDDPPVTELEDYKEDTKEESFVLQEDTKVQVSVDYQLTEEDDTVPVAKVISEDAAYTLSSGKDGTLSAVLFLNKGEYKIKITGLNGRTFSYRVTEEDQ